MPSVWPAEGEREDDCLVLRPDPPLGSLRLSVSVALRCLQVAGEVGVNTNGASAVESVPSTDVDRATGVVGLEAQSHEVTMGLVT